MTRAGKAYLPQKELSINMVVIVNCGMGNLRSVRKAVLSSGTKALISGNYKAINKADKIILPGVGHFAKAAKELKRRGIFSLIKEKIESKTPFLGICLGMQLLFKHSEEAPGIEGFGIIKGKVKKFSLSRLTIPHMGWNTISRNAKNRYSSLLKGIKDDSFFYFAHSYYCKPQEENTILTTTHYGTEFASSVHRDNIWAVQFHPEKSQKLGLKLLNNFLSL